MNPLETSLTDVRDIHATGAAVAETSFYPALANLLNEIGKTLKPKVRCIITLANACWARRSGGRNQARNRGGAGDKYPVTGTTTGTTGPSAPLRTGRRLASAILALGAALIAGCGQPESQPNMEEHGVAGQPTMETEQVVIVNEHLAPRPVDLKQGGQFIEPLCNLIPSMIAQQVANDSFEDEPAFGVAYVAETDRPHRPWYPSGSVHMAKYSRDTQDPFNGKRSQKIVVTGNGCRAGISQDGLCLRKGVGYMLRLHLRGEGGVQVRAWLHGDGGTAAGPVDLGRAAAAWAPAEARLLATRSCDNATLTIDAEGPGALWLDRVYLIGEDAVLGLWRPDVVAALKRLESGVIRWGGSAIQGYDWLQGIGPWDRRVPFTTCWGGLEANFVGQEEFVQLCRAVDAEPLLCIRWGPDKAEEAAAQVEYFNGPPETRYGSLRAGYGHREPYKVRYWQIGNEVAGKEYDESFATIARAMKAVDPSIKTFASCETTERLAGSEYADYLCPHHYGCGNLPAMEASFNTHRAFIAREAKGRPVRMAITEWNTTAGDFGLGRGMLQTLSNALACSRYQNLMHRHADLVEMAMRSNLVDSFGSGIIQTGPGWLYVTPTYHSQRMYQAAAGSWPLKIRRPSPQPWHEQQPDLSAVLSPDGRTLRVFAVNSTDKALRIAFRLEGLGAGVKASSAVVLKDREGALSAEAMNSRDDPLRMAPTSRPVEAAGSAFTVVFEPFSLTRLDLGL